MNDFSKNIFRLYLIKVSKWFNLVMPIVVLFYQDNNMGMQDIFVLKAIYSLAIVVMEIPSGWMADVWGRKKTLVAGSFLGTTGFLIYCFSYGFWAFAIAEIILGIGHAFVSGADSAMLYDSLKASKRTEKYVKIEGITTSVGNFAEAFAGIAGGLLAAISLRTPFYFQFVVAAVAIPAALTLIEPRVHSIEHIHSLKKLALNIKNSFVKNHNLRTAILLSSLTGTATLTFAWLVQPFFMEINLPVELFGVFWTALNLSVGVSSVLAHKFEMLFSKKVSLLVIIILLSIGYILSGVTISYWGFVFLFLFYFMRGIASPIFKNYINQHTGSEMRATILSARDFLIRIVFAVIGPALGWITDNINLQTAFFISGGLYMITTLIIVFPWLRKNDRGSEF